ncbi:O-methyltransferase [Amycolatopsis minnesotensis]|uniref:Class I SAM-dependent methyltransferase n=1 Tax=Amycolatopsis minnesotensis TaxID=337894 RepID=A0ABN2QLL5_9PSEU
MPGSQKAIAATPEIHQYLVHHGRADDPLLEELARVTRENFPAVAHMTLPLEEAALLSFLVRLTAASAIVEVGMFTGSSTIALARALPPGGTVLTCEIDPRVVEIGAPYLERAGVADRVDVRVGPALDTLRALPATAHLDLVFIDADKPGYLGYWEELVPRVRPDGLLIVDNTLFSGDVVDPEPDSKAAAVHAFNEHARADERVELVMVNAADGITLARRRAV